MSSKQTQHTVTIYKVGDMHRFISQVFKWCHKNLWILTVKVFSWFFVKILIILP